MVETTKTYNSYAEASKAACTWVNSGKPKVQPAQLHVYTGKLGDGRGKAVGVAYKSKAGVLVDLVRIDIDEKKGIHFNAVKLDDSSQKFAAVIKGTDHMPMPQRRSLYLDYLKGVANRSAGYVWNWWSTGKF